MAKSQEHVHNALGPAQQLMVIAFCSSVAKTHPRLLRLIMSLLELLFPSGTRGRGALGREVSLRVGPMLPLRHAVHGRSYRRLRRPFEQL